MRWLIPLAALVAVPVSADTVPEADTVPNATQEDRISRLEEQVRDQQQVIDRLNKGKYLDTKLSLTDGLRVQSADGKVEIHVGGRFQEHYRAIIDRPDGARTQPNTFFVRAARLQIDGTFFGDYGFMVQGDFPSSSTGATPTLQQAFVEWKRFSQFRLMFGQFKAPASQERLTSRLFSDFVEDSPLTRFVPGYDIGIQAHGKLFESIVGWQLALINGRSHLDNQGRSRTDDNDDKEIVGRVTLSPFATQKESPFRNLRFGTYGSVAQIDAVAITGATTTTFDISTPELGVTFFDPGTPGAVQLDGHRVRVGAEISYALGPAAVRAEFLYRQDEMRNGLLHEDVPIQAWYVTVTYLLTGEDKAVEGRIAPSHPFDFRGGWGAVELALRVAGAEIGSEIQEVGVSLAGQARRVTSYTTGINWWLTRNTRISGAAVWEDYHDEINFGGGRTEDDLLGFLARFQIDF